VIDENRFISYVMNPVELELEAFVRSHHLIVPKQTLLLAVSGGIDSMVMLHLFSQLRKRMNLNLSIVHVNHQLRGNESMEDEQFVREISFAYGLRFYCERVDVVAYAHEFKLSKQAAARQLRYECFERVLQQINAHVVATAHHADDNAETILLNILRGTGIHGLAGIPIKREVGRIIRPLLFTTRKEIENYAMENGIKYRNDSSNMSLVYRRNLLRHSIIPHLVKRYPRIVETLNMVADTMRDVSEKLHAIVDEVLRTHVHKDSQDHLMLNVKKLKMEVDFLWDEVFMELLHRMHIEPTEKKIDALHKLCMMPTGRIVELTGAVSAYRDREFIVFKGTNKEMSNIQYVEVGRIYEYQGCCISISNPEPVPATFSDTQEVEYIDAERLGHQLILRPWHAGDWFIPLGMKTKKKLSDFFTDQKVPRFQKASIPVLESDGAIVWICGKRLDNRFKLTEHTRTVIRLTYQS
jgi:tRNA(Ile)-lysidine synthase